MSEKGANLEEAQQDNVPSVQNEAQKNEEDDVVLIEEEHPVIEIMPSDEEIEGRKVVEEERPVQEREQEEEGPVESVKPTEPVEPVELVESIEPVKPEELEQPVEPVEPIEPIEPIESVESAESVKSIESIEPVEPVETVESVESVESVEPVESVESVEPVGSIEPIEPVEPVQSAELVESLKPIERIYDAYERNVLKKDESRVSSKKKSLKSSEYLETEYDEIFETELWSPSSSTIYLESIYRKRSDVCSSLRSTLPPQSWPSSANLSKDSDVYPIASEYVVAPAHHLGQYKSNETLEKEFSIHTIKGLAERADQSVTSKRHTREMKAEERKKLQKEEQKEEQKVEKSETSTETDDEIEEDESITEEFCYLENILNLPLDKNEVKSICFPETLLISCELTDDLSDKNNECKCKSVFHKSQLLQPERVQEMGGMCLNIENARCNLITFCTTQFSLMGTAGASRILSVVDCAFSFIEEKKTEWHCTHEGKIEKSLHVAKNGSGYVAFRTETKDKKVKHDRGDIKLRASGDFVLDGGLFALMRYLIISKFSGELQFWSMNIEGELCTCKLIVGKKKLLYINDRPFMTIRIKRWLYVENKPHEKSKTYFLPTGQMVRHKWKGCKYFIHLNPYAQIPPIPKNPRILSHNWKDDVVLVSKYLDEKEKRRSEIQTYMGDNPEIKTILHDYMLCLVQLKPENVFEFTIEYFTNLFRD